MISDRLAQLVVECTERIECEGRSALDAVCAAHPDLAAELKATIEPLLAAGLVGASSPPSGRPDSIGDYRIVRELGRGGMGVVYAAEQTSLRRTVALKVLADSLLVDAAAVERFRREGETAAQLQHRGIAQVFAVGRADGFHFLAMERIDGAPLDRVLGVLRSRPVGSLDASSLRAAVAELSGGDAGPTASGGPAGYVRAAATLGAEVASALACAHAAGIVHRDVKPSNVMLRRDASAVLTDFGLARRVDQPGLTRSGAFAGTPFYTSPEQAAVRPDVDHRTDLFSLGALLYELLTLQMPFRGASSSEVLNAIQVREAPDPRRWNAEVPRDLVAILQRLLEKEPRRRYGSADDVLADLHAFLDHRPVSVRTVSAGGRLARWARRQPLQAAMLALLLLGATLLAGLGSYVWLARDHVALATAVQRDRAAEEAILAGFIALGEARFEAAEQHLREALTLRPDDVEAWVGLTRVAMRQDEASRREALAAIDARAALLAQSRSLQRCRAQLLANLGQQERAAAEQERLGPPREPLELFLAGSNQLLDSLNRENRADMETAYGLLLDAVVQSRTARPAFLYYLATAAGELGNRADALRAARALETFWPDSGYAWAGIGLALHGVDPTAAIAAYRRALELMPGTRAVRNNLANALERSGQRAAAILERRAIVDADPLYAIGHYNLGRTLFYAGQLEDAAAHMQRAVSLSPLDRRSHHYLGWSLLRLERQEEALEAARAAVAALPDDPLMWRDLARAHLATQDAAAAAIAARTAVERRPDEAANHSLLADALVQTGDLAGARASLERAVELTAAGPARVRAAEDLVRLLIGVSAPGPDPAAGLQLAAELAEQTQHRDPWVLQLLAEAKQRCGDPPGAIEILDRAIRLLDTATAQDEVRLREVLANRREALLGIAEAKR